MNLTDKEKEELLRSFYVELLLPFADKLRERNIELFPMSRSESAATYYQERKNSGDYIYEINSEETSKNLKEMWNADLPELAALTGQILKLAKILEEHEEDSGDVSPFVYAMF